MPRIYPNRSMSLREFLTMNLPLSEGLQRALSQSHVIKLKEKQIAFIQAHGAPIVTGTFAVLELMGVASLADGQHRRQMFLELVQERKINPDGIIIELEIYHCLTFEEAGAISSMINTHYDAHGSFDKNRQLIPSNLLSLQSQTIAAAKNTLLPKIQVEDANVLAQNVLNNERIESFLAAIKKEFFSQCETDKTSAPSFNLELLKSELSQNELMTKYTAEQVFTAIINWNNTHRGNLTVANITSCDKVATTHMQAGCRPRKTTLYLVYSGKKENAYAKCRWINHIPRAFLN